ncbi:MAG TPA: hypothetical protein VMW41_02465 [Candidatus Bathyarchaeia archaeon]|nr:hypothetical protein [Candidatus Bathyarchaeia archaeon]
MRNIEKHFNKVFKTFLIFGVIFLTGIFLFGKLSLLEQINEFPALVLFLFVFLILGFGYVFSKGFGLRKSVSDFIEKEANNIDFTISIYPTNHSLLKRFKYFFVFPC